MIIPARNERDSLPATLNALAGQVDGAGCPLRSAYYEVLLLLNNCTDDSLQVALTWQREHPSMALHIFERHFERARACVGTARRLLMDTAWQRLAGRQGELCGILSTDGDTAVARDWIYENMQALGLGADAVGGRILLDEEELACLPSAVRRAHMLDCSYQRLVAEWEDRLDPQAGDPWPRHLEHFGASLACTPEVYARAGGLPAVDSLEDVAFVDALLRVDARLRHEPKVMVRTSGRLEGRVDTGFSGQLRSWKEMDRQQKVHRVPSLELLTWRFRTLGLLRKFWAAETNWAATGLPKKWSRACVAARKKQATCGNFLAAIDCDRLIDESFRGKRESNIEQAIEDLQAVLAPRELRQAVLV